MYRSSLSTSHHLSGAANTGLFPYGGNERCRGSLLHTRTRGRGVRIHGYWISTGAAPESRFSDPRSVPPETVRDSAATSTRRKRLEDWMSNRSVRKSKQFGRGVIGSASPGEVVERRGGGGHPTPPPSGPSATASRAARTPTVVDLSGMPSPSGSVRVIALWPTLIPNSGSEVGRHRVNDWRVRRSGVFRPRAASV